MNVHGKLTSCELDTEGRDIEHDDEDAHEERVKDDLAPASPSYVLVCVEEGSLCAQHGRSLPDVDS